MNTSLPTGENGFSEENITRIANAVQCHSLLSGQQDCHEFWFSKPYWALLINMDGPLFLHHTEAVHPSLPNSQMIVQTRFAKRPKMAESQWMKLRSSQCESESQDMRNVKLPIELGFTGVVCILSVGGPSGNLEVLG